MENIWNTILLEMEKNVSRPVFLTFFKPAKLISFDRKTAVIFTPTDIGAEYLEKRFSSLIKNEFRKHFGRNTKLIFKFEAHAKIPF